MRRLLSVFFFSFEPRLAFVDGYEGVLEGCAFADKAVRPRSVNELRDHVIMLSRKLFASLSSRLLLAASRSSFWQCLDLVMSTRSCLGGVSAFCLSWMRHSTTTTTLSTSRPYISDKQGPDRELWMHILAA